MDGAEKYSFGNWETVCNPEDGGRLESLVWNRTELLTSPPPKFRAPQKDFGLYETRPVFGYDDCFPSVDPCGRIPDHGELCWKKWAVSKGANFLELSARSEIVPALFTRRMEFHADSLTWRFSMKNKGGEKAAFMHVMHALLPLENVDAFEIPHFSEAYDEAAGKVIQAGTPEETREMLLQVSKGSFRMLILRRLEDGFFRVMFKNGTSLEAVFPRELFDSLGIWWNNGGHPDEAGLGRLECAFEPISGNFSSLEKNLADGRIMSAPPGAMVEWEIKWKMKDLKG